MRNLHHISDIKDLDGWVAKRYKENSMSVGHIFNTCVKDNGSIRTGHLGFFQKHNRRYLCRVRRVSEDWFVNTEGHQAKRLRISVEIMGR